LNLFDYLLLAIVGLSMVLSLWRGFLREIISLIGLIVAFLAASRASAMKANPLHNWISNTMAADIAGFVIVFIVVMIAVAFIGALVRKLVDMTKLTASDRTLGVFFGLARGVLLIGLFFLIYTSYAKPDKPWMKASLLTPYAIEMGNLLGEAIPEGYPFSHRGSGKVKTSQKTASGIPAGDKKALASIIRTGMQ